MDLSGFRTEISAILGLDNSASTDQPRIDSFVNEGVAHVLVQSGCHVRPFEMTLTAGEEDYTLSTSVLSIVDLSVSSSSDTFLMERVTPAEILALRRADGVTSTSPPFKYAVAGSDLLMLWPTPASADTITGLYVPRPATLSSGTDTPSEIPAEWHRTVVYYACFRAADMDDDASSQMGERYRMLFEADIPRIRAASLRHGGHRMTPSRLNSRRRRNLVPHSNSADW